MNSRGFSLIELMLVILILALFATFAYPSYRESIIRSRRIDGETALIHLANQLEHYFTKNQSYQGATLGTGTETDILSSNHSSQQWYQLKIVEQTDTNFSIEARPIRAQAMEDKSCPVLTLNNHGLLGRCK